MNIIYLERLDYYLFMQHLLVWEKKVVDYVSRLEFIFFTASITFPSWLLTSPYSLAGSICLFVPYKGGASNGVKIIIMIIIDNLNHISV